MHYIVGESYPLHSITSHTITLQFHYNTQPIWRPFQVLLFLLKYLNTPPIWSFQVLSLLLKHSHVIFLFFKTLPLILHTTAILPLVIFTYNINMLQSSSSSFFPSSPFETHFFTLYRFYLYLSFLFVELLRLSSLFL